MGHHMSLAVRAAATALLLCPLVGCASSPRIDDAGREAAAAARFEEVRNDRERLRGFLREMPLGGDLHHHAGGSAPPGMMIAFAAEDGLCLPRDPAAVWRLSEPPCRVDQRRVAEALDDSRFHAEISRRWSMEDFASYDPAIDRLEANEHFFAIFGKIRPMAADLGRLLAGVRSEAAGHGIIYLETSSGWVPDRRARAKLAERPMSEDLGEMRRELLADPGFQRVRDETIAALPEQLARSEELLGCAGTDPDPGCDVEVRLQRIAIRNQPPAGVFVQALLSYEVARALDHVVAVNLVAPETGEFSLRDYALHMRIYGFLAGFYPEVRCTLHAAEMTDALSVELGATEHLSLAVAAVDDGGAGAHRIGHGVALDSTTRREAVLARMRELGVAVELNLRSNELLLGVRDRDHPLPDYLAAGVPIVLSTDDAGLMLTDLTEQFELAAAFDEVDYATLKRFALNSIEYSFLAEQDKRRLLDRLRSDFDAFEARWAAASGESGE